MNTNKIPEKLESQQIILKEKQSLQKVQRWSFDFSHNKNMTKNKPIFIRKILGVNEYDKQLGEHQNTREENIVEVNYQPYKRIEYLLSASEYKFYKILRSMLGEKFIIFPKVRIADIVEPSQKFGEYILFSKIKAKHVDFLVCYKDPVKLRMVIELDGSSHELPERKIRDNFVDEVFANAGIPIVHIKTKDWYDKEELKERIRSVEKIKYVIKKKELLHSSFQCSETGIRFV